MQLDRYHNTSSISRIVWIDYAKVICLFFVYLAHSSYYSGVCLPHSLKFFHTFYVDAFFILSGYLFFRVPMHTPRVVLTNVFYRIVLPSVIFSFIIYFPKLFIRSDVFSWNVLLDTTIGGRGFWFTSSLAVAQICMVMVMFFRPQYIYIYMIVAILLLMFSQFFLPNKSYPWFIRTGLAAVILLVIGGIYRMKEDKVDGFFSHWRLLILVPLLALYIWLVYYYENLHILGGEGNFNVAGIFCVVFSSYVLIRLFKLIKNEGKIIKFIGGNSILFYFFSGAFPSTISIVLIRNSLNNPSLILCATLLLSIVFAYVTAKIITRFFPFMLNLQNVIHKK